MTAAVLTSAGTWRDETEPAGTPSADPKACVTRNAVAHEDHQLGARVWTTDYVCSTRTEAPLYLTPSSTQRIGFMDTPRSWLVCWLPGREQADGGRVWYYTRGDRTEPGAERWAGWGFLAAEQVNATEHPWPEMPRCNFPRTPRDPPT